ncbi:MAG: hypothetical protein ABJF11_13785 [Reichenbachiella sp.]|uniref:hypothetical protein n=1 Tax=Reichenbachiella sp. TaxID=2184521 RepID=UPI003264E266
MRNIFFIGVMSIISSCSQHYFDRPQPIDARNIYVFPEEFRGIWTDGSDSIVVTKFYFANIEYKNIALPYNNEDTTRYALFYDGKVYPYDSAQQKIMGTGYPYVVNNDSAYYQTREVLEAQLGRKAVLRAVGDQYMLNVKSDNQWWEIFLMSALGNHKILVCYPNIDQLEEQGINPVFSNSEEDFFEVEWSSEQLERLIQKKVFSDTLLLLDQQYQK